MDKEQIEQAANAYTQEIIDSNTFEVNFEEDNYDAGSLYATSKVCPMAFEAGAEWRINSVWHAPCDIAEPGKDSLVEHMDGDGNVCIRIDWRSEYEWVQACHYDKILRWAYVEDLLPTKGGENDNTGTEREEAQA